jgi:hypothetical protein
VPSQVRFCQALARICPSDVILIDGLARFCRLISLAVITTSNQENYNRQGDRKGSHTSRSWSDAQRVDWAGQRQQAKLAGGPSLSKRRLGFLLTFESNPAIYSFLMDCVNEETGIGPRTRLRPVRDIRLIRPPFAIFEGRIG